MRLEVDVLTFTAGGSISQNTFVKFSADNTVVAASAATDSIIGVCVQPGGCSSGDRCDVQVAGVADVKMGGTVARGGLVTADSSGQGVAPAPSTGVNNRVAGIALLTAASGDITEVLLSPGSTQG
jgi:hypothetical protein